MEVNYRALEKYLEQIRKSARVAKGEATLDAASLLSLPGVLQPPANEEARLHRARDAFVSLLDRACAALMEMRASEGRMLEKDLEQQRGLIQDRLAKIATRAPAVVQEYQNRLLTRIQSLAKDASIKFEPADLIKEIAVWAERTDIAEEVTRLGGHIDQFRELLDSSDDKSVGRTLDFLAQEMLREANTIASKSPDAEISRHIVEVKGAIDRIKEQVQNVE